MTAVIQPDIEFNLCKKMQDSHGASWSKYLLLFWICLDVKEIKIYSYTGYYFIFYIIALFPMLTHMFLKKFSVT